MRYEARWCHRPDDDHGAQQAWQLLIVTAQDFRLGPVIYWPEEPNRRSAYRTARRLLDRNFYPHLTGDSHARGPHPDDR